MFNYQLFTRWMVANLPGNVRFEWVEGHWKSCRTNRFCTTESHGANHSFRTCMKADAIRILTRVRNEYPHMKNVTMVGHSAGTTAMLELLADAKLPDDWSVDRLVFMAPGAFREAPDAFNTSQRAVLASRAARDATAAVAVYSADDVQSGPAARSIAAFWGGLQGVPATGGMAPFRNCGSSVWPGGVEAHSGMQDDHAATAADFLAIARDVRAQGWGSACVAGPTPPPGPVPPSGYRFHCNKADWECVGASEGHSSISKCAAACRPPGPAPPTPPPTPGPPAPPPAPAPGGLTEEDGVTYQTADVAEVLSRTQDDCLSVFAQHPAAAAVTFFPDKVGSWAQTCFVRSDTAGKEAYKGAVSFVRTGRPSQDG